MPASNCAVYHCVSCPRVLTSSPASRGSVMASKIISNRMGSSRRGDRQTATGASYSIASRAIAL